MAGFFEIVEAMAAQDFFAGLLPLIVSYAVFYMALRQVPLFTDDDGVTNKGNKFAGIIAFMASLMVARFMYLNPFYQNYFVEFFGHLVVGIVGLLGLMTVLGFLGFQFHNEDGDGDSFFNEIVILILAVSAAGASFYVSGGFGPPRDIFGAGTAEIVSAVLSSPITWMLPAFGALLWITFGTGSSSSSEGEG